MCEERNESLCTVYNLFTAVVSLASEKDLVMIPSGVRHQDCQFQSDKGFARTPQKLSVRNTDGFGIYFHIYVFILIAIWKEHVHSLYLAVCQQYYANIACLLYVISLIRKYVVCCLKAELITGQILILYM
jgi:hypothetical protein